MQSYLDFEKPVADLEAKIVELKSLAATDSAVSIDEEVNRLSARAEEALAALAPSAAAAPVDVFLAHGRADLDAALIEMIESPAAFVLNVMVPHQEHVLPMIPSGMTVKDIIKA